MNFWGRALLYGVGLVGGSILGQAIVVVAPKPIVTTIAIAGIALLTWGLWEGYRRVLILRQFNNEDKDDLVAGFQRGRKSW